MAMFPCITGIPTKLNSDMQAVLNKKMGTSGQTYPSQTWADEVNLLGPLPEKTVSGAIANFSDGADEVPLKAWDVTVNPNLDGVSSVEVNTGNKNFFDDKNMIRGLPATAIGSSINDINTPTTRYVYNGFNSPRSNIAIRGSRSDSSMVASCLFFGYKDGLLTDYRSINPFGSTVTIDCSGFDYVRFSIGSSSASIVVVTDLTDYGYLSVEYGTTFTEYVPSNTTVTTVPLGRTIYGGSADVVNGTGTDENGNDFTFTPITPTPETALGVNNFWADEGDSEVTYRADIDLVIQALQGNRGLMVSSMRTNSESEEMSDNSDNTEEQEEER